MKTTRVSVLAGVTSTEIPCTIPCKYAKIVEDSDVPTESLVVTLKQSDHTYASEVTFGPGVPVRIQGYSGIIARPAGYSAYLLPATGEALCKIRTVSGSAVTVRVQEFENTVEGQD